MPFHPICHKSVQTPRAFTLLCDLCVLGEDGEETVGAVSRADPDVLVLDIRMPKLNGLQVAARLHESCSRTKIVFLRIHKQPSYVSAPFAAGQRKRG